MAMLRVVPALRYIILLSLIPPALLLRGSQAQKKKKRKKRHQMGCRAAFSHHRVSSPARRGRAGEVKVLFMLHPSCLVKCPKSKQRVLLLQDKPYLKEKHFLPFSFLS